MSYQAIELSDFSSVINDLNKEKPHLVLLDIKLSEGVSGIDIARSMKSCDSLKSIPIIVVSAFALKDEVSRIKAEVNCDDYLVKPFSINRLEDAINDQLCSFYGD